MKTLEEIKAEIKKAVENDEDASVYAYRKSDNFRLPVVEILGDTDTTENYIEEMEIETNKLTEFSKWEIAGYEIEID